MNRWLLKVVSLSIWDPVDLHTSTVPVEGLESHGNGKSEKNDKWWWGHWQELLHWVKMETPMVKLQKDINSASQSTALTGTVAWRFDAAKKLIIVLWIGLFWSRWFWLSFWFNLCRTIFFWLGFRKIFFQMYIFLRDDCGALAKLYSWLREWCNWCQILLHHVC